MDRRNNPRFALAAKLRLEGALFGKPEELGFDPAYPYTYCRLCGEVYQKPQDRNPHANLQDALDNMEIRRNWSHRHSKTHPDWLHKRLAISGLWCLPEAAEKLAAFGIAPVGSGVLDDEVRHALALAPRLPSDDAEGS